MHADGTGVRVTAGDGATLATGGAWRAGRRLFYVRRQGQVRVGRVGAVCCRVRGGGEGAAAILTVSNLTPPPLFPHSFSPQDGALAVRCSTDAVGDDVGALLSRVSGEAKVGKRGEGGWKNVGGKGRIRFFRSPPPTRTLPPISPTGRV